MEKFKSTEELLAWIIDFFAISFGNSAILKGGMSLRLLHSPRFTNDVDYVFIPFDSKKDVKQIIEKEEILVNGEIKITKDSRKHTEASCIEGNFF